MQNLSTPTKEDLKSLAEKGYSFPRIADKYNRSKRFIRTLLKLYPDIEEQVIKNGRIRTPEQERFGRI